MMWMVFMVVMYFVILTLFMCYAWLQMREAKRFTDWCIKADTELKGVRGLAVALEERVKVVEDVLAPIESEPDLKVHKEANP